MWIEERHLLCVSGPTSVGINLEEKPRSTVLSSDIILNVFLQVYVYINVNK